MKRKRSTAPTPDRATFAIPTIPSVLLICAVHPDWGGRTHLVARSLSEAFDRLRAMGERWHEPTDGWRLRYVELMCPNCLYTNQPPPAKQMVEIDRHGKTFCASCGKSGKADLNANADGPDSVSGSTAPKRSPARTAAR